VISTLTYLLDRKC